MIGLAIKTNSSKHMAVLMLLTLTQILDYMQQHRMVNGSWRVLSFMSPQSISDDSFTVFVFKEVDL